MFCSSSRAAIGLGDQVIPETSPSSRLDASPVVLNEFTDEASTSSCVKLFRRLTDQWEKQWRHRSLRPPFFINFQFLWPPGNSWFDYGEKSVHDTAEKHLIILIENLN